MAITLTLATPLYGQDSKSLDGVVAVRVAVALGREVGPHDSLSIDTARLRGAAERFLAGNGIALTTNSDTRVLLGTVVYAAPTPTAPERHSFNLQVMVEDRVALARNPSSTFPATIWQSQIFFGHATRRELTAAIARNFAGLLTEFVRAYRAANKEGTHP